MQARGLPTIRRQNKSRQEQKSGKKGCQQDAASSSSCRHVLHQQHTPIGNAQCSAAVTADAQQSRVQTFEFQFNCRAVVCPTKSSTIRWHNLFARHRLLHPAANPFLADTSQASIERLPLPSAAHHPLYGTELLLGHTVTSLDRVLRRLPAVNAAIDSGCRRQRCCIPLAEAAASSGASGQGRRLLLPLVPLLPLLPAQPLVQSARRCGRRRWSCWGGGVLQRHRLQVCRSLRRRWRCAITECRIRLCDVNSAAWDPLHLVDPTVLRHPAVAPAPRAALQSAAPRHPPRGRPQ